MHVTKSLGYKYDLISAISALLFVDKVSTFDHYFSLYLGNTLDIHAKDW